MTESKPAITSDAEGQEERVSTVVGDRLCAKRGFNLFGQMIVREPRYKLLIVRCPECATVAALQEYPLLGKWANRWATALAALWVLALVASIVGFSGAGFGMTMGSLEQGADRRASTSAAWRRETARAWSRLQQRRRSETGAA